MEYDKETHYIVTSNRDDSYQGVLFKYIAHQANQLVLEVSGNFRPKHYPRHEVGERVILSTANGWGIEPACVDFLKLAEAR